MTGLRVASDIGGTFTDTVVIDESGGIGRFKAPTVPSDPAAGVLATLELAAAEMGLQLRDLTKKISFFSHGTTVATNALLEGKVARTALIQTRGFGDTVAIMRGFKSFGLPEAAVKDFRTMVKQAPVVPKQLIGEVTERVDYRGRVVVPLDEEDARRTVRHLAAQGAEVFAVALLWSFKNEVHERQLQKIIAEEVPGAPVTLSCELLPRMGEFRRSVTTAINGSLRPVLQRALRSLESKMSDSGVSCPPLIMQSHGGLAPVAEIDRKAAATVMSGPVGGVVACAYFGQRERQDNIVATDMGGTSFEVGLILKGQAHIANSTWIGRHEIGLPSVSVRTVGAGSGSLASVANGLLRVGPESAGAVPGPACYGAGGRLPTVADADLVLYAYSGAGPLHAFSYGAELGIGKVMAPATASVHSAFGIAVSDLTVAEEMSAPILSPPGTTDYSAVIRPEMVQASFDRLTARAYDRLREEGADLGAVTTSRSVEMRFRFQIHALTIPSPEEKLDAAAIDAVVRRFIDTYEARFGKGSAFTAAGIELTTYRVVASCGVARPELRRAGERAATGSAAPAQRQVHIEGRWRPARILLPHNLRVGARIDGIAIIEMPDTTIVIGPGQHATMDDRGNIVLELAA